MYASSNLATRILCSTVDFRWDWENSVCVMTMSNVNPRRREWYCIIYNRLFCSKRCLPCRYRIRALERSTTTAARSMMKVTTLKAVVLIVQIIVTKVERLLSSLHEDEMSREQNTSVLAWTSLSQSELRITWWMGVITPQTL